TRSPRALGHSGDEALVGQLAQADPADAELAVDSPRPAAAPAAGVAAGLDLGPAPLAHDLGRLGHWLLYWSLDCSGVSPSAGAVRGSPGCGESRSTSGGRGTRRSARAAAWPTPPPACPPAA